MVPKESKKNNPESKKRSPKSIAFMVTTQKRSTWQIVKKQWSEQMQSTIKTSNETKTWRNENKKKWKHEKIKNPKSSSKKQNSTFLSMRWKKFDFLKWKKFFELSKLLPETREKKCQIIKLKNI